MEYWIYWVVGAVLTAIAIAAGRYSLGRRFESRSSDGSTDPEVAAALRKANADMERGKYGFPV